MLTLKPWQRFMIICLSLCGVPSGNIPIDLFKIFENDRFEKENIALFQILDSQKFGLDLDI